MNVKDFFVEKINRFSNIIAKISYVAFTFSAISITVNVFMRYIFDSPILGVDEVNRYLIPVMAFAGLAYAQFKRSNVRMTIITSHLEEKYQKLSRMIGYILGFIVVILIGITGWNYAMHSFAIKEATLVGASTCTIWWSRFALPIGMWSLGLQFVSDILNEKYSKKGGV